MDNDSKKMARFGLFIVLVLLFALGFFIWGFIAKGTLVLSAEAPFSVKILDGDTIECAISPCEIRLKIGTAQAFISKEGYKSLFIEPEIKLWKKTDVNLIFQLLPTLIETDVLPGITKEKQYSLEDENGSQKLIDSTDPSGTAIVYFQKELNAPRIFGHNDFVLILDKNIYKVNTKAKTREELKLTDLTGIIDGKWSASGEYFIFSKKDSLNLWLLDSEKEEIYKLNISSPLNLVQWFYDDTLVFGTDQTYNTATGLDDFGNGYTDFLDSYSSSEFTFGFFYPHNKTYSRLASFSEITQAPDELIALANGESIYLKIGEKNFRIILRKF